MGENTNDLLSKFDSNSIGLNKPILASTFTGMSRAMIETSRRQPAPDSLAVKVLRAQRGFVQCQGANTTSTAFDPYAVAIISGQTIETVPGNRETVVDISERSEDNSDADLVLCLDRIEPGAIGPVCVMGVCWAESDGSAGEFASVAEGERVVTLSDSGVARVISGSGASFVLLRIGGGSGTAEEIPQLSIVWNEGPP